MDTVKKRPVYLNLFKIHLPVGGVVSIAHRVTGVVLAVLFPFGIYLLQLSLRDASGFDRATTILSSVSGRIAVLLLTWIFAQHFFSGVRHLLLDLDVGVEKGTARRSAWLTWVGSVITVLLAAVWII
ncbi:MAG: succinate dehydrogenase, cytochrome b556 subunit [Acidiferrobacterales bacterium]